MVSVVSRTGSLSNSPAKRTDHIINHKPPFVVVRHLADTAASKKSYFGFHDAILFILDCCSYAIKIPLKPLYQHKATAEALGRADPFKETFFNKSSAIGNG